jgi:hypothetical protein
MESLKKYNIPFLQDVYKVEVFSSREKAFKKAKNFLDNCIKGNLIRSILFPKEVEVKFKSDSNKYIMFMSVMTIVAFIPCVFLWLREQKKLKKRKMNYIKD